MPRPIALAAALATASLAGAARADDHLGILVSGNISAGSLYHVGAEAEAGWRIAPWIAALARAAATGEVTTNDGFSTLGIAARIWPAPDAPAFYVEPQLGRLSYDEVFDCTPGQPNDCTGGHAVGWVAGAAVGYEVARGEHVAAELRLDLSSLHWTNAATGAAEDSVLVGIGFGLSFY